MMQAAGSVSGEAVRLSAVKAITWTETHFDVSRVSVASSLTKTGLKQCDILGTKIVLCGCTKK
jgi:hypothetical protein